MISVRAKVWVGDGIELVTPLWVKAADTVLSVSC